MAQSKVLELKDSMVKSGFLNYPVLEMEESFEPSTDDHVGRQKETGKFLKRLNKLTPAFDETWHYQLKVYQAFYEFRFLLNTVCNSHSLHYLTRLYAKLDLEYQELQKVLKKHTKASPEMAEYYQAFSSMTDVKVFDLFAEDMAVAVEEAKVRYQALKEKNDDYFESFDVELEDLLAYYKTALKEAKKKK